MIAVDDRPSSISTTVTSRISPIALSLPIRPGRSSRRGRIDRSRHLADPARREAADPRMLAHRILVLGQIDAEGLVRRHEGFEPLHPRRELGQSGVRRGGRAPEIVALQPVDARYITLDHIFLHGTFSSHGSMLNGASARSG